MGYQIKPSGIVYGGTHVSGADPETFEAIDEFWGRDQQRIYWRETTVSGVDPDSFVPLNAIFGRDVLAVFTPDGAVDAVALESFTPLDSGLISQPGPEEGIFGGYARDARHVFHYALGEPARKISEADTATFTVLGNGFARDNRSVYFQGHLVPDADPGCEVLRGFWVRDSIHVFFGNQIVVGADPASFQPLAGLCGKDKKRVYFRSTPIPGADPSSFELLESDTVARDRNRVYVDGQPLEAADPASVASLGRGYFIDARHVFHLSSLLAEADRDTFAVLPALSAEQKSAYLQGKLKLPEPAAARGFTAVDKYRLYKGDWSTPR